MRNPNHIIYIQYTFPRMYKEKKKFFLDLSNQFFCLEVVSFLVVREEETIPENLLNLFFLCHSHSAHAVISMGARNEIIMFFFGYVFCMCTLMFATLSNFRSIRIFFVEKHSRRASL